jgi:hypothetical protein
MEVPQGWKPLTGGHGKDLVLTLDFEAVGRPEACFTDLVPMLDLPLEAWAAAQPHFASGQQRSARTYLRHWSGSLRETGREVRAVLGYCAGAVYAATLAEEIACWQPRLPAVVLLDPDPPTAETLIKQFEKAVTALGAVAPGATLGDGTVLPGPGDGTGLSALGDELTSLYRDVSEPAFARIGLKPGYRHELVASFCSLMSYLAAAADIRPGPGWAAATAIVSATHPREPAGVARQVSAAADHAGLLRDAAVARLVSELLR